MSSTIVADDSVKLVEVVKAFIDDNDIKGTICVTSLEQARKVIAESKDIRCFVADLFFEGSREDGITLLEMVKRLYPAAKCILLTGYKLSASQMKRLSKIHGELVYKWNLTEELLQNLLSGEPKLVGKERSYKAEVDIGELKLRFERMNAEMKLRFERMNAVLDEMIKDIYRDLESIENQNDPSILAGVKQLSAAQLRKHLLNKDDIGIQLIKIYRALNKRLREGQL